MGVTYEAVRKQLKRYSAELEGHIHQKGRTQYLDDEAVAFLDQHHAPKPIAIYEAGQDREMREMAATIDKLRNEKEYWLERAAELADWKAEKAMAIAEAAQTKLLLEAATAELEEARKKGVEADLLRAELEKADQIRRDLEQRAAEAENKVESVKNMTLIQRLLWKGE